MLFSFHGEEPLETFCAFRFAISEEIRRGQEFLHAWVLHGFCGFAGAAQAIQKCSRLEQMHPRIQEVYVKQFRGTLTTGQFGRL